MSPLRGGRSLALALRRTSARARIGVLIIAIVAGTGISWAVLSSRSGPTPKIALQSPVDTALSWFSAINSHNTQLALEHFVPAERGMMKWSSWGPPFTHLDCSLTSETASHADVYCTFATINDPAVGTGNESFWSVSLRRDHVGPWLIDNYGQG